MNTSSFNLITDDYIRAAPDTQLSSSETHLLHNLLSQEDQLHYNQTINIQLSDHILHILNHLTSLLYLDSSTIWMTTILLKKLTLQQYSIDLLTIIASTTLSHKYQHSQAQDTDYDLIAQYFHVQNIQLIHDTEIELLDIFSYDICETTPHHFFSYLTNLSNTNNNENLKQTIEQARSLLSTISHQTFHLLHKYPSSIVALSLISNITSNTFIIEQIKSFLLHKKDPQHYVKQLRECIFQLQSYTS
ncbi:unnamed protein product [Adineta steineri]|uniref:Uncharacterized protein n=1 Tax=Adineta steineri TaxID=433720 RepID=A0A815MII8_9BILA|nr:unnamed protein product [Adineta steineri]